MRILDSVERLRQAMDYHLERHNLLTANLAHVDTPGFRPLDLERTGFAGAMSVAMQATDPGHLGGSAAGSPQFRVREDRTAEGGADGNAVSLDREAVKIATNNIRYEALSSLVAGQLATLAWAANDGRGG